MENTVQTYLINGKRYYIPDDHETLKQQARAERNRQLKEITYSTLRFALKTVVVLIALFAASFFISAEVVKAIGCIMVLVLGIKIISFIFKVVILIFGFICLVGIVLAILFGAGFLLSSIF